MTLTRLFRRFRPHLLVLLVAVLPWPAARAELPELVGRVAVVEGTASLRAAESDPPLDAPVNMPLAAGAVLRTAGDGRVLAEFPGLRLWLAGDTEVAFAAPDGEGPSIVLHRGSIVLRADPVDPPAEWSVSAANGRIDLRQAGRYRIDAGVTWAAVRVVEGLARVAAGPQVAYLTAGQSAEIGQNALGEPVMDGATVGDDFERWAEAHGAGAAARRAGGNLPALPGAAELDTYGRWQDTPEYGPIWSPYQVPAGWVPYRDGQWVWIAPWGWTWIDAAPWGFVPFHYGRWVFRLGRWVFRLGRWCWVPGRLEPRPVFAPALVHMHFDGPARTGAPIGTRHQPPKRWTPLTPYDRFVPRFRAPDRYVDRVNAPHERTVDPRGMRHRPPVGEVTIQHDRAWNRDYWRRPRQAQVTTDPQVPATRLSTPQPSAPPRSANPPGGDIGSRLSGPPISTPPDSRPAPRPLAPAPDWRSRPNIPPWREHDPANRRLPTRETAAPPRPVAAPQQRPDHVAPAGPARPPAISSPPPAAQTPAAPPSPVSTPAPFRPAAPPAALPSAPKPMAPPAPPVANPAPARPPHARPPVAAPEPAGGGPASRAAQGARKPGQGQGGMGSGESEGKREPGERGGAIERLDRARGGRP